MVVFTIVVIKPKKKNNNKITDTDNSMITRGKWGGRGLRGYGAINGDGRRLDLGW